MKIIRSILYGGKKVMIPIKDDLQPKKAAYITWVLLALNALVFSIQLGLPDYLLNRLYYLYGIVPSRLVDWQWAYRYGFPDRGLITLITSLFLHGGWLHFLANNWTLWLFGDDVEDRIGHLNFALLYFLSGLIAGLTHVAFLADSMIPAIGASGAVAGVMGAFLFLYPKARIHVLVPILFFIDIWKIPAALYLPLWFLGELFSGTVALISPGFSGIAFWAHVGGFLGGALLLTKLLHVKVNPPQSGRRPGIIHGDGFIIISPPRQY